MLFGAPNYNYGYPWNSYGTQVMNTAMPQQQQPQQQLQVPQTNGINWVQGEAGAKSYALAPGQSVLLMDSENDVFYIKSSDNSGMPMPLRVFDYVERKPKSETIVAQPTQNYVTREEFEKRLKEITTNGKQHIPTTK
jgi:hypothetical protein